jgi:pyruvate/2-oxoglutarate/acetoin dehydrogenase E1 component
MCFSLGESMSEQGRVITYADAGVEALREEMARNDSIVYIGQGIGPRGGNFRQTRGLWKEFGDDRLRDTGICELGATGVAIGAAMAGTRTVVDEVFLDFALEAITQIIQQAANISYMSNGKIKAPVLIRGAMGAVRNAGAHHSHTFYNWFANTPGLKVVLPSNPYDLKGLFKSALRAPGPVVLVEHKSLYNTKGDVPKEEYLVPFGDARIVREGHDLTIIAMSRMVDLATKAAAALAREGISAEVIDPRSIVPLDRKKITDSVKKTGKLVVIDESPSSCSFAAELLAIAVEDCFNELQVAPKRICSLSVPNPFSPVLENQMIPSVDRIVSEVRDTISSSRRKS